MKSLSPHFLNFFELLLQKQKTLLMPTNIVLNFGFGQLLPNIIKILLQSLQTFDMLFIKFFDLLIKEPFEWLPAGHWSGDFIPVAITVIQPLKTLSSEEVELMPEPET